MEPMIEVVMTLEKQTKNKLVYGSKSSFIPSLYIDKNAFPDSPSTITVTVKQGDKTHG
jgi:hypothetical protein